MNQKYFLVCEALDECDEALNDTAQCEETAVEAAETVEEDNMEEGGENPVLRANAYDAAIKARKGIFKHMIQPIMK